MSVVADTPESGNVEWKESWRDEYLKWICGFANAKGGRLYIGVDDNGNVVGVKNCGRLLEDIPSKIQMSLGIVADVDRLVQDGKEYIEIAVQPSSFPVSYRGEFHYRSGSTKRQLTGFALADFVMRRTDSHWDEAPVESVSLGDVDQESIKIFKREALRSRRMSAEELDVPDEELLDKLGVLVDGKLTRAGVLLFTENHFAAQTATYTKVGMFGEQRHDLLYQDTFDGSLINTADKIVDTIYLKYLRGKVSYEGVHRVETYPFDRAAVREGIYNALIHNVYMMGTPIQIRIDNRAMEISNSCILPEDWTGDTLMASHNSVPYNPSIANVFYRMGYIESWGRGIEKIVTACDELGAPRPEYQVLGYGITLVLHALESAVIRDNKGLDDSLTGGMGSEDSAGRGSEAVLSRQNGGIDGGMEERIVLALKANPRINQSALAAQLGIPLRTLQRLLKQLRDLGLIERKGGNRYGYWEIDTGYLNRLGAR